MKKLLSFIISATLVFGVVPHMAFATENDVEKDNVEVAVEKENLQLVEGGGVVTIDESGSGGDENGSGGGQQIIPDGPNDQGESGSGSATTGSATAFTITTKDCQPIGYYVSNENDYTLKAFSPDENNKNNYVVDFQYDDLLFEYTGTAPNDNQVIKWTVSDDVIDWDFYWKESDNGSYSLTLSSSGINYDTYGYYSDKIYVELDKDYPEVSVTAELVDKPTPIVDLCEDGEPYTITLNSVGSGDDKGIFTIDDPEEMTALYNTLKLYHANTVVSEMAAGKEPLPFLSSMMGNFPYGFASISPALLLPYDLPYMPEPFMVISPETGSLIDITVMPEEEINESLKLPESATPEELTISIPNISVFGQLVGYEMPKYEEPVLESKGPDGQDENQPVKEGTYINLIRTPFAEEEGFSVKPNISSLKWAPFCATYNFWFDITCPESDSSSGSTSESTDVSTYPYLVHLTPYYEETDSDLTGGDEQVTKCLDEDFELPTYPYFSSVEFEIAVERHAVVDLVEENAKVTYYGEDALRATVFALATALNTKYDAFPTDDDGYDFSSADGYIANDFYKLDMSGGKYILYLNLDYDAEAADDSSSSDTTTTTPEGGNNDQTVPEGGNNDQTVPDGGNTNQDETATEEDVKYDVSADITDSVDLIIDLISEIDDLTEDEDACPFETMYKMPDFAEAYAGLTVVFEETEDNTVEGKITIEFPEKADINMEFVNDGLDAIIKDKPNHPLTFVKEYLNAEFGYPKENADDSQTVNTLALREGEAGGEGETEAAAGVYDAVRKAAYDTMTFIFDAYKVTFDADGGTPEPKEQTVKAGEKATKPEEDPKKTGYKFDGWMLDGKAYDFDTEVTKDITLTAKWTKEGGGGGGGNNDSKLYKVYFVTNGGTKLDPVSYKADTEIDPSEYTTTKEGDTFLGWYRDSAFTKKAEKFLLESDVTLYAKWQSDEDKPNQPPVSPDKPPFDDITPKDWFYKDVIEMYEKGLMSGMGNGKFEPNISTERAMVVSIIYRLEGSPAVEYKPLYSDVEEGKWYTDAIIWTSEQGISSGYPEGDFKPDQIVSRQELARFIYMYACYKGAGFKGLWDFNLDFDDADKVGSWAKESVQWCVMNGLITGVGNNLLAPRDISTRAQLAAIFNRFSKLDLAPAVVEEEPAEEQPDEEQPAEETPAAETPAEETPAEETPAAETPAEEVTAG